MSKDGRDKDRKNEIWAIGGGKGGTGKSFITSCMGTYLASKNKRVVLIDADLGGANLHTFLGVSKPKNSLTDFFERKLSLNDIIVNCGMSDLGLVSGTLKSLEAENIKYAQKVKLFRHIKSLDTDYVLIDLGAGSHGNTMDTFLLADKMIVVIVPELTAIENMYHFVKNVFFRKLKMALDKNGFKSIFHDAWKNKESHGIRNLKELTDYLMNAADGIKDVLDKEMSGFSVHVVLNQVRSSKEAPIGLSVKSVCMKFLGLNARYTGHIIYDDSVAKCINKRQPFMITYPFSNVAKEVKKLVENLVEGKQVEIGKEEQLDGKA